MSKLRLVRQSFDEHPAMDVAVSHAVVETVAQGEMPEVFRLFVPSSIVAFGSSDRIRAGYGDAVRAATAQGYAPVERLAGGRAAVFNGSTLAFSWARSAVDPRSGTRDRFEQIADVMTTAFRGLGVDARIGEVPGEYCPGRWSVNVAGRLKVMGVGQRLIRGASHVGGVVVVSDSRRIRDVLVPVYRALGISWDPNTAGSIVEASPGIRQRRVAEAILDEMRLRFEIEEIELPVTVVDRARSLIPRHLPEVA